MRITFIATLQDYWGGSEVLWVKTAELAVQMGHSIQVVVYKQTEGVHPALQHLKTIAVSFIEMPNTIGTSSFSKKAFLSIKNKLFSFNLNEVINFRPECILINQVHSFSAAFHPAIFDLLTSHRNNYYLISHFNSEHLILSYPDILKARKIFDLVNTTFFVSTRNHKIAERQIAQQITSAEVIGNHPNIKDVKLIGYPPETGVTMFASVARLDAQFKGQDILFQVLAGSQWRDRSWHLNIYGTGPDEQYLKDLSRFYHLESRITFHGHVSNVTNIWEKNHVLLMPSTAEGKPLALEEAMMCGRIAVATDVAGNGELVDDGVNGFLALSYFPSQYNMALEKAWSQKHRWKEMGIMANQKAIETLDINPEQTILKKMSVHSIT